MEWETHARALLVWLPLLPVLVCSNLYPASGVLSDSLAESEGVGLALAIIWAYVFASIVEYLGLVRSEGLWVAPLLALTVLTTRGQELLSESGSCRSYCVLHNVSLGAYTLAELVGLYRRGYSMRSLAPYGLSLAALAVYYRTIVAAEGFDATNESTLQRLRIVGALEVLAFLVARALVSAAR